MKKGILLVSLFACVGTAAAQEVRRFDLFAGFSYSRGQYDIDMYGWNASLAGAVNRWLSTVGDFSGNYARFGFHMVSVAAGPQFGRHGGRINPFARAMAGINHVSSRPQSQTDFSLILGAGLDVRINDRIGLRVLQVDFMRIFADWGVNQGRVSTGLTFRF
jgi:hypothetical protein